MSEGRSRKRRGRGERGPGEGMRKEGHPVGNGGEEDIYTEKSNW